MHEHHNDGHHVIYFGVVTTWGALRVNEVNDRGVYQHDRYCPRYPNTMLVDRMQFPRPLSAVCNYLTRLPVDEYNKCSIHWWEQHEQA